MDAQILSRYSRQIMLPEFGIEGQRRLGASGALIVGLGGLGAPVASYLACAGVGRLGLCDADTVDISNLQRQVLYSEEQTGMPKAAAAAARLRAMAPDVCCELWPDGLTPDNAADIIARYDIVVDCCDNYATRYLIDDTCRTLGRPWVYGSIGAFHGQLALMGGRRGARYRALYPECEALCARGVAAGGVLGPVPGTIGAMQASEALRWLAGIECALDGVLFSIDLSTFKTCKINL